jgi:magnesium transporter
MAITGTDEGDRGYLEMSAFTHFKRRVIWLVVLAGLGIVSGYVIYHFEEVLSQFFILAIYMPMLAAAGGNTGAQSATLVIRAMSLGEFQPKDILLIVWKELRVGLMLALVLAAVSGAKVLFMSGGHADGGPSLATFALIVSLALGIQVITSSVFGAILPMLAKMAKLDPAVVASPAITTFVDVSGLLIYFSIAKWVLGI